MLRLCKLLCPDAYGIQHFTASICIEIEFVLMYHLLLDVDPVSGCFMLIAAYLWILPSYCFF